MNYNNIMIALYLPNIYDYFDEKHDVLWTSDAYLHDGILSIALYLIHGQALLMQPASCLLSDHFSSISRHLATF